MSLAQPQNENLVGWLRGLKDRGLRPTMEILEETTQEEWEPRECHWIGVYREHGAPLTNVEAGGKHEPRAAATREKLTKANLGVSRGPEFSAKMTEVMAPKKGQKRPPEIGEKVRAAKTGKKRAPFSAEWRQKISIANTGKKRQPPSAETRERMSLAQKNRWSNNKPPSV